MDSIKRNFIEWCKNQNWLWYSDEIYNEFRVSSTPEILNEIFLLWCSYSDMPELLISEIDELLIT